MIRLQKELARKITYKELQAYSREYGFLEGKIRYWLDRRHAQSVDLKKWINECAPMVPQEAVDALFKFCPNIQNLSDKSRIKKVLEFVHANIVYTKDDVTWKVSEKWQTPSETWELKTGDCEDGAVLIYSLLKYIDISDNRLRIVAGDVVGGGHCYLVWLSNEDGLEYVVDWCYWYNVSVKFSSPYHELTNYYNGTREWFSFNMFYNFKRRKRQ